MASAGVLGESNKSRQTRSKEERRSLWPEDEALKGFNPIFISSFYSFI
jgi:hypothetical protein